MDGSNVESLNARHGITGHVQFREGPAGQAVADVTTNGASLRIVLQGAHITSWVPRDSAPVIWVSEAARFAAHVPIRGGVPVCWPWFATHPTQPDFPFHGFARTTVWDIVQTEMRDDDAVRLTFRLPIGQDKHVYWPHPTELWYSVTVSEALELELTTRNVGSEAIRVDEALHAYFHVSHIENVSVHGLDGATYFDKTEGTDREQRGPVTFAVKADRVYRSTADCLIRDPGLKRSIRVVKRGSQATVVWNPRYEDAVPKDDFGPSGSRHMVCVESANVGGALVIAPGAEHRLWSRYSLEALT